MKRKADETITWSVFTEGLWRENPVFVMLLGMCPTLAVSNTAINALSMGLATTFVLISSGALVSILRNVIPGPVRIATYIIIIATFVTIVDYLIQAISRELYNALGAFIQLIVVNCIILGRAEAFASKHRIVKTMVNAAGMGLGFTLALSCLGVVREILGAGSLFGIDLFGPRFEPWVVMILPPGGFIVLSLWLVLFNWFKERAASRKARIGESHAV